MNPFAGLIRSRKFWLMILDLVISFILYFVSKYGTGNLVEDVKFVIAAIQPVFVVIIGAIAYEDANKRIQ
jgi:uncharacterized membrane protein YhaH (DUF805 family)